MTAANRRHPARTIPFDRLVAGLEAARAAGTVARKDCVATGRSLYCYTQRCVYEKGWDDYSVLARGLILDLVAGRVVATPFPKFFNHGERTATLPDLPFEVFEKVDGSLVIIHHHAGRWRAATKGAFGSGQAKWAEGRLGAGAEAHLDPAVTYLAEAVYPENRIVVRYPESGLVLLAAYRPDGTEFTYVELTAAGSRLGWRTARRYPFDSWADLVTRSAALPATEEGFVIRFADGYRLKLKGAEYRRIHAMISRCTPLALWEAMAAGDDLEALRRDLPEEFWADFDTIRGLILGRVAGLWGQAAWAAATVAHLSDKEVGLKLPEFPDAIRPLIFGYRKAAGLMEGKVRQAVYRAVRPTGNYLAGYEPSSAMSRVQEEVA